jgi:hypothetical protein
MDLNVTGILNYKGFLSLCIKSFARELIIVNCEFSFSPRLVISVNLNYFVGGPAGQASPSSGMFFLELQIYRSYQFKI